MNIPSLRVKPYFLLAALLLAGAISLIAATQALATHQQDFSITKTASSSEVAVGDNVTFTLQVSNTVSSSSSGGPAQVTDQLPAGLELVSYSVVQQPSKSYGFTCSATGDTVTCYSPSFGNSGTTDTATIEIVAKRTGSGDVTNTATIQDLSTEGYPDTNLANNTSSVTIRELILAPQSKDDCKDGGHASFGFKNQGDCVSFVTTEGKNESAGTS